MKSFAKSVVIASPTLVLAGLLTSVATADDPIPVQTTKPATQSAAQRDTQPATAPATRPRGGGIGGSRG